MISNLLKESRTITLEREQMFETLMKQSYRQAYNFAFRLCGNSTEAEDLVQETFLRAYRFFYRYDEALPFINWLYRIMCNAHIDMVRRRGRLRTTSIDQPFAAGLSPVEIADTEAGPDSKLLSREMDAPVQLGLKKMNPEFRTAVLLADVEGMAYEEIAAIMGTSVGTVRSRIHRGRKQLRNFLVRISPSRFQGMLDEM